MKRIFFTLSLIISGLLIAGTAVTWNGSSYTVPSVGEENWFGDDKVDGLLISLANNGFQKTGGTFTLTSEVDFGGTAGLTALYWGTRSSNDSTAGIFRLSNAESIGWRNAANSANLLLTVNSSNDLTFNGTSLMSSSGLVPVSSGGTGLSSYSVGDLIYATPNSQTLTKLPVGTTDYVLKSNGTVPQYGQIVNASVDSSAAIARSKLASGTADHVVINSGAGAFSSEAQLAVSRGGTNIGSYSAGDLVYASSTPSILSKLPIGTAGQVLKVSGGLPAWSSAGASASVTSKTADYALTSSDDVVVGDSTSRLVILALPEASTVTGKVYYVKRSNSGSNLVRVSASSGDTLDGVSTLVLGTQYDEAVVVSDGSDSWHILSNDIQVGVRATGNAGTVLVADTTNLDFSTEGYDTHNAWNGSLFTAPVQGLYEVLGSWYSAANAGVDTHLYKNGSKDVIAHSDYASASRHGFHGFIRLSKDDTLSIRQSGTPTLFNDANNHWISITRIGN